MDQVVVRFLEAVSAEQWAEAAVLLNGLSTADMLVLLDRMGPERSAPLLEAVDGTAELNSSRVRFLATCVSSRELAEVPAEGVTDAQPPVVENFLKLRRTADVAQGELGVKEIRGKVNHPQVIAYFKSLSRGHRYLANLPDADSKVPWCAAFVNYVLEQSGVQGPGTPRALAVGSTGKDPQNWGTVVGRPAYMSVAILRGGKPGTGHVGFVVGTAAGDKIVLLGGNQSNAVNLTAYPKAKVIEYRVPPLYDVPPLDLSLPELADFQAEGSTR